MLSPFEPWARSPFGGGPLLYSLDGTAAQFVMDVAGNYYRNGSFRTLEAMTVSARTTPQTCIDNDGVLKWGVHNSISYSNDFSSGKGWTYTGAPVISAASDTGPFGNGSWQVVGTGAEGFYKTSTIGSNIIKTRRSIWVKAVSGAGTGELVDPVGTVGSTSFTANSSWQEVVLDVANGSGTGCGLWIRNINGTILVSSASLPRNDLGGMQLSTDGSTYIETVASAVYAATRTLSNGQMAVQSWPARTNLFLNSGVPATQTVTVTAVEHTISFIGAGTVTLTGVFVYGGIIGFGTADSDRASLTFTPTAGDLIITITGTIDKVQLEVGSSASPYIPTTTAAVSRGADNIQAVQSGSLPFDGYDQTKGTMISVLTLGGLSGSEWLALELTISPRDGGIDLFTGDIAGRVWFEVLEPGWVSQARLTSAVGNVGVASRYAAAWQANDFAFSVDGTSVLTDSSGSIPTSTVFALQNPTTGQQAGGTIAYIAYYPARISNTTLVTESAK